MPKEPPSASNTVAYATNVPFGNAIVLDQIFTSTRHIFTRPSPSRL
jgi:hypothetical protein